jgi:hypothetical protein
VFDDPWYGMAAHLGSYFVPNSFETILFVEFQKERDALT